MYKRIFSILFILQCLPQILIGQDNLVPNPSFEILSSKPKKIGELDKAKPWISPTLGTAEIFWSGSKADDIKAPANSIGFQEAHSGDNYAGAIFYDKKNKNMREYLQVKLTEELEEGKVYCLEFYVSISDLSKYSIDLIGGHFGKNDFSYANMEPIPLKPQVINKQGRLIEDQINWEIICGEYMAKGGERYLTIGNFADDKELKFGKMKKPKDMKSPQNDYGYYYIDDVSVIEQNANYKCDCYRKSQGAGAAMMKVIYSKVSGENDELLKPENLIESKIIRFEENKADISPASIKDLDLIVKLLQENSTYFIDVYGFADESELVANPNLNLQRAKKVEAYLDKQGIRKDRTNAEAGLTSKKTVKPSDKDSFRRVEFSISLK